MPKDIDYSKYGLSLEEEGSDYGSYGLTVEEGPHAANKGLLDKIVNSSGFNALLGAGDAPRNFLANALNLVPGVKISPVKSGEGTAYDIGNIAGDVGTFLAGGEALGAARGASEAVPYIGKLAQLLKGAPGQVTGAGAFGAINNPGDRLKGALKDASIAAVGETALSGIPALAKKFMPKKAMKNLINDISNSTTEQTLKSKALYNQLFNEHGGLPVIADGLEAKTFKNTKLKPLYEDYKQSPTFENAHELQSQLGALDRELQGKDVFTWNQKANYKAARDQLNEAIKKSLAQLSPDAAGLYDQATRHYFNEVIPHKEINKALNNLVDPTPGSVLEAIKKTVKKGSYPKISFGQNEIPIVPENISVLSDQLSKILRNKNMLQKGSKAGVLVAGGLGVGEAYHPIKNLIYKAF